ncbi:MAG: TonB C-terminal domain-containing protein [Verrucomicrobiales bacterium]|nr:TonB C-terminal domain-containing protein [Verrucomicrobiales bacterium]
MPVSPPRRGRRASSRVDLLISAVFHAGVVLALAYFAAREGLLGKELKKIAVEMVRETPPEPEKPPEPEPKPEERAKDEKPEEPPPDAPEIPSAPAPAPPPVAPPPSAAGVAPPPVAPPAVDVPSFSFEGGRAVRTSSDPIELYRHWIEHSLRSRWDRPADVSDRFFVAEVDVEVDRTGAIRRSEWRKRSGHSGWDASVQAALSATPSVSRPPPTNFPSRITVRFDVAEVADVFGE